MCTQVTWIESLKGDFLKSGWSDGVGDGVGGCVCVGGGVGCGEEESGVWGYVWYVSGGGVGCVYGYLS